MSRGHDLIQAGGGPSGAEARGWMRAVRTGFTLMEVMMSVVVITLVMFVLLQSIYLMNMEQKDQKNRETANRIAETLAGRLQDEGWSNLGVSKWSWQRPFPDNDTAITAPGTNPNSQIFTTWPPPPMREADLVAMGIIQQAMGVPDLRVYVEYYRMGLLDRLAELTTNGGGLPSSYNHPTANGAYKPMDAWRMLVRNEIPGLSASLHKDYWINSQGTMVYSINSFAIDLKSTPSAQIGGAYLPRMANHPFLGDDGVLIRILVTWTPSAMTNSQNKSNLTALQIDDMKRRNALTCEVVVGRRP